VRAIDLPVEIDFLHASSDTTGTAPGALHIFGDLATDIGDRDVLVVDDILSTGNTLSAVMTRLAARWPRRLEACVLIDKPVLRQVPVDVRWTGFAKPDAFYVGCGMGLRSAPSPQARYRRPTLRRRRSGLIGARRWPMRRGRVPEIEASCQGARRRPHRALVFGIN
jgi:pimeloyl-ACP methyl ester carboxylesterase